MVILKDKGSGRIRDVLRMGESQAHSSFHVSFWALAKNHRYTTRTLKKLVFDLLLTMDVEGKNSCYNDRCNCDGRYDFHVSAPYPEVLLNMRLQSKQKRQV